MRLKLVFLLALILTALVPQSSSQNRLDASAQPGRVEAMRNQGLDTSRSGFPVVLPREWGRLISVQKTDAVDYTMFLQNDAGEIYLVNLIQRGKYLYLDTYDNGGTALVIKRGP